MQPTLDTNVMHEIVRQHEQRLRSDAGRHALAHTAVAHTVPGAVPARARHHRRARHRIATALRHLAERIEPARLETRPAGR